MISKRAQLAAVSAKVMSSGWLAGVVLAASLTLTGFVWHSSERHAAADAQSQFESAATRVAEMTRERMLLNVAVLRGGAVWFMAPGTVSRDDWRSYVSQLELKERLGVKSMGFTSQLSPDQSLRAAMERARDIGKETASFQSTRPRQSSPDTTVELLMYAPVYETNATPRTVTRRRADIRGYVFGVFDAGEMLRSILRDSHTEISCQISGTEQTQPARTTGAPSAQAEPAHFATSRRSSDADYPWTLHCRSTPNTLHANANRPLIVLAAGIPISLLLFAIAYSRATLRRRARALANKMTTEIRQSAEERQRQEAKLRQAQKLEAISTLSRGIANDFNNIVAEIVEYTEHARKEAPAESPLRRYLDNVTSAGARAKTLLGRILAFSRSGLGERNPMHAQSIVIETLDRISASLPASVRLGRELHASDAAIVGDPAQIQQVVSNLCANAMEAMDSGGVLTVYLDLISLEEPRTYATATLPPGDYVRLRVRDSGIGIPPELLERIFNPFFTTNEGTGLGLTLIQSIASDLGGAVDVQSEVGHGSTVTVLLPRHGNIPPPLRTDTSAPGDKRVREWAGR